MSITGKLRRYASAHDSATLFDTADHIDAEHEREVAMARCEAVTELGSKVAREYVKLPVDADGVPIHVGDVIHYDHDGVRTGTPETVKWIAMGENEVRISTEHTCYPKPSTLRHHHEPTVEDMLREFADRYLDYEGIPSAGRRGIGEALMDEYADRIREAVQKEGDK